MPLFSLPHASSSAPPRIVVPVLGADEHAVLAHAVEVARSGADVAEWRLDAWGAHDGVGAVAMLPRLRAALDGLPVLATYRSRGEGGPGALDDDGYAALLTSLLEGPHDPPEGIDLELTREGSVVAELTTRARAHGVSVVGSSHDFAATPSDDELDTIFDLLAARGSDVLKVAVTPADRGDVLRLLDAAHRAARHGVAVLPVAMGEAGALTRVAGQGWGAPATFAMVGAGSAPGQVPVAVLRRALDAVDDALRAAAGPAGVGVRATCEAHPTGGAA
ncbi:type I 3-dehydroquinate dehydratase [Litorihabitans aurantiacus]|uniref:3-dehydroquinate dehydratase n=1 Tax=Litorihabitans aurantiacus TaxID=1930061 RepID=A0AA37UY64_9MICO|nr:type I 3-dehydroquinate dehydratase [Litorihabitans aurantiacus]GMA31267.1 3-dehydroquinate dehydratase [Litorihabitans aurantiacus]